METIQLKVRIPARRVRAVRAILEKAGTDAGGFINMVFAKIENTNTVPFAMLERDPEIDEVLADPEAMQAIRDHKAGKLKMKPFRPCVR